MKFNLPLTLIFFVMAWSSSQGAEIRLRRQCVPSGRILVLGDVAEILSADLAQVDALSEVELFPAPVAGETRTVRVRELQDLLMGRGVNLAEHRFSGSSQVQVESVGVVGKVDEKVNAAGVRRANRRIEAALVEYVQLQEGDEMLRTVQFELPAELVQVASDASQKFSIEGGKAPWLGQQQFQVKVEKGTGVESLAFEARVEEPIMVVAAAHSMARGAIVGMDDVVLVSQATGSRETVGFSRLEEVVGQETSRAVADGMVLSSENIQSPLLIRRGEVVTLYGRSAGIRVRTTVRARESGSMNDLITVESMLDRGSFQARVSGVREAEVFAQAVAAGEEPARR